MRYPVFREPGYGNTSNPFIGRALDGTQDLVQDLEELCSPDDTIITAGGTLVQPLMYRRALTYGKEHVGMVRDVARRLRVSDTLGGIVGFAIERVEMKQQHSNKMYTVRALLGNNAVRRQLIDERRFVQHALPSYADRQYVVTSLVRVAETPSLSFANTVADQLISSGSMSGELLEPEMLFTPPYGS